MPKWIKCSERMPAECGWFPVKIRNRDYGRTEIMWIDTPKIMRVQLPDPPQNVFEIATKEELQWLDDHDFSEEETAFNAARENEVATLGYGYRFKTYQSYKDSLLSKV